MSLPPEVEDLINKARDVRRKALKAIMDVRRRLFSELHPNIHNSYYETGRRIYNLPVDRPLDLPIPEFKVMDKDAKNLIIDLPVRFNAIPPPITQFGGDTETFLRNITEQVTRTPLTYGLKWNENTYGLKADFFDKIINAWIVYEDDIKTFTYPADYPPKKEENPDNPNGPGYYTIYTNGYRYISQLGGVIIGIDSLITACYVTQDNKQLCSAGDKIDVYNCSNEEFTIFVWGKGVKINPRTYRLIINTRYFEIDVEYPMSDEVEVCNLEVPDFPELPPEIPEDQTGEPETATGEPPRIQCSGEPTLIKYTCNDDGSITLTNDSSHTMLVQLACKGNACNQYMVKQSITLDPGGSTTINIDTLNQWINDCGGSTDNVVFAINDEQDNIVEVADYPCPPPPSPPPSEEENPLTCSPNCPDYPASGDSVGIDNQIYLQQLYSSYYDRHGLYGVSSYTANACINYQYGYVAVNNLGIVDLSIRTASQLNPNVGIIYNDNTACGQLTDTTDAFVPPDLYKLEVQKPNGKNFTAKLAATNELDLSSEDTITVKVWINGEYMGEYTIQGGTTQTISVQENITRVTVEDSGGAWKLTFTYDYDSLMGGGGGSG